MDVVMWIKNWANLECPFPKLQETTELCTALQSKEKTMAIVDDNTTNDQGNTGARQDAYQNATAQNQKGGMWSFHQTNLTKSPVAAGVGGEYFTKFRTAINELFKDIVEGVELKIISLNRQNAQEMRFSAIVVAVRLSR